MRVSAVMNLVRNLLAGLLVVSASVALAQTGLSRASSETCYLFSYFVGNGEDGLHLARSTWANPS